MESNGRQSPTIGALAKKLAKILGEVGKVEKTGHNSFHKYDYVTENDLVYAVRGRLSEAGIFIFESTIGQKIEILKDEDKSWALTSVTTEHTFVDSDSGEWFSVQSQGQGADNGDKGGYKAITGAMKYFIYKNFMIPTGDDPEADEKTDQRAAAGRTSTPKTTTGAAPRSAPTTTAPEVPRAPETDEKVRAQFRDKKWEKVVIHFGKNQGKSLGSLADETLYWYIDKWQPKPYNGTINPDDVLLRAALDVAGEEIA